MSNDLETQDTEPLSPDAARVVELERQIGKLRGAIEAMGAARRRVDPVLYAALALGRNWNAALATDPDGDYTEDDLDRLDELARAVATYDENAPKG